jgi:hypothetical protein
VGEGEKEGEGEGGRRLHLPLILVVGLRGGIFELFEASLGADKLVGLLDKVT